MPGETENFENIQVKQSRLFTAPEQKEISGIQDETRQSLQSLRNEIEIVGEKREKMLQFIRRQYQSYVNLHPLLVYNHFKEIPQKPSLEQMVSFLKDVYQKKEAFKKEIFGLQNTPKEISEVVQNLVSELAKKYLKELNTKEGIDFRIGAIYKDTKDILLELKKNLELSGNPFAKDIELFIKHFFLPPYTDPKTGKKGEVGEKYVAFTLQKVLGAPIDPKEEYTTLYDIATSGVGALVDEAKLAPQEITKKLDILKKIPQVAEYIKENPDFSILLNLIAKVGRNLDTAKTTALFAEMKPDFFILLFSEPTENPEAYKKARISFFSRLVRFTSTEIFGSLASYDKNTQREVLGDFFKLSYFESYKSHPLYQMALVLQENENIDIVEIYQSTFSLLELAITKGTLDDKGSFNQFIDKLAKNYSKLTPDEQKKILELLKVLIPETVTVQKSEYQPLDWKNDSAGTLFSKVFSNAKAKASDGIEYATQSLQNFFLEEGVRALQPSQDGGTSNILSDETYRKIFWESLKKVGNLFSDDFAVSMREALLQSAPKKLELKKDTDLLRLQNTLSEDILKQFSDKVKARVSQTMNQYQEARNSPVRLGRKEFLQMVTKIAGDSIQDMGLQIPPALLETIISHLGSSLLDEYSKEKNPLDRIINTRLALEGAPENLAKVDTFVDVLYTFVRKDGDQTKELAFIEQTCKMYGFSEMNEVMLFGKPFSHHIVRLLKSVDKGKLKATLFEKQNKAIIDKLFHPKISREEKTKLGVQLAFTLYKKIPETALGNEEEKVFSRFLKSKEGGSFEQKSKIFSDFARDAQKIIVLFKKKKKGELPQVLKSADQKTIDSFSRSTFTLVSTLVRLYGKETLTLLQNEKILGSKKQSQVTLDLISDVTEAFKSNNTMRILPIFLAQGFDEEKTKNEFFHTYFSDASNAQDFASSVKEVFQPQQKLASQIDHIPTT